MSQTDSTLLDVAVIGAGLAGLSCARALADAGRTVAVYDKARGLGGRMATRRGQNCSFDHGAQYFTARDPAFIAAVAAWRAAGAVAPWQGALYSFDGAAFAPVSIEPRYVGLPGMSGLCRALLGELAFFAEHRLIKFQQEDDAWQLEFDNGAQSRARHLVLALPAPQAAALLPQDHPFQPQAATISMAPCWAVMARFDRPLALELDGCFINNGPLSWVARTSSKPGRPAAEAWVLHASPEWSRVHVNDSPESVIVALLSAFSTIANARIEPPEVAAHRWLYALADTALSTGCLFDAEQRLGLAGDWLNGSRVEGAWLSGQRLAERLLQG